MNKMVLGNSPVRLLLELVLNDLGKVLWKVIWYEKGFTGVYSFTSYVKVNTTYIASAKPWSSFFMKCAFLFTLQTMQHVNINSVEVNCKGVSKCCGSYRQMNRNKLKFVVMFGERRENEAENAWQGTLWCQGQEDCLVVDVDVNKGHFVILSRLIFNIELFHTIFFVIVCCDCV